MYKMTLRSRAREECWTVLLVKPLVKITHLHYSKLSTRPNGKNRVASGGRDSAVYSKKQMSTESSGLTSLVTLAGGMQSYLATLKTFSISTLNINPR